MTPGDDHLRIRPGRVRPRGHANTKRFVNQVLRAAKKAGGARRGGSGRSRVGTFGRGRAASLRANALGTRVRRVTVKARVVRHGARSTPLGVHLAYLERDGVALDGSPGKLFDGEREAADRREFVGSCADDRHHFRFIVSPEDASEMADLKAFTRDLMSDAARDLGTRLEWVAVEHHNTEHSHVHVLVRGRADDGSDLVIARDYIREGMGARAQALVTLELGPRTEVEIKRELQNQIDAERWTPLDRDLVRRAAAGEGLVDLRPDAAIRPDAAHHARLGRMQTLERLGLATPTEPAQ